MNVIAIITARSGSKSVPHKNIKNLGGIPLLGWVVKASSKSQLINKIILSTDSDEYYKIAKSFNSEILFHKRTPELAEDVPTEQVLLDVITNSQFFNDDSLLVLLQPTTPFITAENIDKCIRLILDNPKINTCVSVKKISEYPEWMLTQVTEKEIFVCNDLSGNNNVRQNLTQRYIPNGGIWVIRKTFLENKKKIVDDEGTMILEMSQICSMDIDNVDDFTICESLVNFGVFNPEKI